MYNSLKCTKQKRKRNITLVCMWHMLSRMITKRLDDEYAVKKQHTDNTSKLIKTRVPFYCNTCAKCKVTQLFPNLINFKPLIISKK